MSYATMPYSEEIDSSKFSQEKENPAMGSKMDGGYVVTRPRHTRRPRRTFSAGFTDMRADKQPVFDAFFDSTHGGAVIFLFVHPVTGEQIPVRFTTDTTLPWTYTGMGKTALWNVTFKLQEA
jgi:hypothetical protein